MVHTEVLEFWVALRNRHWTAGMFGFGTKGTQTDPSADSFLVAGSGVPFHGSHHCSCSLFSSLEGLDSPQNKPGNIYSDEPLERIYKGWKKGQAVFPWTILPRLPVDWDALFLTQDGSELT